MATKERMDTGFAVFNCHVNDAKARADAEFIEQWGQDSFDTHIAPLHEQGIMLVLQGEPTPEKVAWVTLCTAFVNEGRGGTQESRDPVGFLKARLSGYESFLDHNQPGTDAESAVAYAETAIKAKTLRDALEAMGV